jgi:hypothetical protein
MRPNESEPPRTTSISHRKAATPMPFLTRLLIALPLVFLTFTPLAGFHASNQHDSFLRRRRWRALCLGGATGEHYFWNGTTTYYLIGGKTMPSSAKPWTRLPRSLNETKGENL